MSFIKEFIKVLSLVLLTTAGIVLFVVGATFAVTKIVHSVKNTNTTVSATNPPLSNMISTPMSNSKTIYHLMLDENQVIVLAGEITESAVKVATEITNKAMNGNPLYLLINSPGGSITDGSLIIDAIESVTVPVYTVCMQLCASMAAITHQYGTERLMLDRSVLMFHDAAGGFQGYFPHIKSLMMLMDRYVSRFNAYISLRTGMSVHQLELNEHTQMWIDAEDAINNHFADKLVYVDVFSSKDKKQVDMKLLLGNHTNNITPTTNPSTTTFFDTKL